MRNLIRTNGPKVFERSSYCESCGRPQKTDERFCSGCGTPGVPGVVTRANMETANWAASSTASTASDGLEPRLAGVLSYAVGVISGMVFLLLQPYSRDHFVRFHAFQSIFFNAALVIFWILWGTSVALFEAITGGFLLWLIIPIDLTLTLLIVATWIFVMIKAYGGVTWKLPIIGKCAERQANK
jgi:uncharacterized membrane protein